MASAHRRLGRNPYECGAAVVSAIGGRAWSYDESTGQYYHHLFLPEQPDLNWMQPAVRDAFDEILRFWFDRGVAGFRIDVVHELVKDPPSRPNRTEIHNVLRSWRSLASGYEPERLLVGETWVMDLEELARFYGRDDELHLALNFPFMFAGFEAPALADVVERTEAMLPRDALPVWALSNHDVVRFPTRMCDEDDAKIRSALLAILTLRGTSVLYYGDELGMRQVGIPTDRVLDVHGRDGARTPMPWGDVEWRNPWLPLGANVATVAEQLGLAALEHLTGLKELDLSQTTVSDAGLAKLAGLKQLQVLKLAGTLVEGKGMGQLTGLTGLRELDLSGSRVDDEVLSHAGKLTGIERMLSEALQAAASREQIEEINKEIKKQLRPYRSHMEPAVYEQTVDNFLLKRLREQVGVPRLSLFYL